MKTVKKFILQRRDAIRAGEWTDTGVEMEKLEWVKTSLKSFPECEPQSEFRIVERTVITIDKPVKL